MVVAGINSHRQLRLLLWLSQYGRLRQVFSMYGCQLSFLCLGLPPLVASVSGWRMLVAP